VLSVVTGQVCEGIPCFGAAGCSNHNRVPLFDFGTRDKSE
jgi:hypothetical protein